jgi:hypothetical protein
MRVKARMDPCFTLISGWLIAIARYLHCGLVNGYHKFCRLDTAGGLTIWGGAAHVTRMR